MINIDEKWASRSIKIAVQKKRRDERTGIGNDWVVQGIEKAIQTVFEETIQKRSGRVGRETAKRGGGKDKGDDVGNGSLVVGRWGEEPHSRTQPATGSGKK